MTATRAESHDIHHGSPEIASPTFAREAVHPSPFWP